MLTPMRRSEPAIRGQLVVRRCHASLQFYGASDRIDGAAELDQNAVSNDLEDAAMMATDEWLQDLPATGRQHGHRRRLVLLHEAAESNHVSGKDGG